MTDDYLAKCRKFKLADVAGQLVRFKPLYIESVPARKAGGPPRERLHADIKVYSGVYKGDYPCVWLGQTAIVEAGSNSLAQDGRSILCYPGYDGYGLPYGKRKWKLYFPHPTNDLPCTGCDFLASECVCSNVR